VCFSENQVRPRKSASSQCDIGSDQFSLLESQELLSREVVLFQVVVTRSRDPGLAQARVPSNDKLTSSQDVWLDVDLRTSNVISATSMRAWGKVHFSTKTETLGTPQVYSTSAKSAGYRVKDRECARCTIHAAITEGCASGVENPSLIVIGGPYPQFPGRGVVCRLDAEY
jgi:hypothetical protein